ncbi:hypothetical protein EV361DRAFT_152448 [Lentinula raphanica]|uniref:Uncharacterized protein n=1 Tax=Lentinula raphanica TaxID=153919 RepID=A0AA38P233_9AGAR|nr:hypothetical protein F5880DRAFT_1584104 [Lentinula raphanica]KAJ3834849.1 hypothetical protein F5878DRAFT_339324 [Lentinula raphanica]KAJ3972276.1 hypothetical protein EV361DRAFT_152448 [Lentinula raphanica]
MLRLDSSLRLNNISNAFILLWIPVVWFFFSKIIIRGPTIVHMNRKLYVYAARVGSALGSVTFTGSERVTLPPWLSNDRPPAINVTSAVFCSLSFFSSGSQVQRTSVLVGSLRWALFFIASSRAFTTAAFLFLMLVSSEIPSTLVVLLTRPAWLYLIVPDVTT